jgi:rare lipoprotein A
MEKQLLLTKPIFYCFPNYKTLIFLFFCLLSACNPFTDNTGEKQRGIASFYAGRFGERNTANGEKHNNEELTASHSTLPFGTLVSVKNIRNDRSVVVRINDRGPYRQGRIIDVSHEAAQQLGMLPDGLAEVEIEVVGVVDKTVGAAVKFSGNVAESATSVSPEPESTGQQAEASAKKIPIASAAERLFLHAGKVYDVSGNEVASHGYGVQVGLFYDLQHALKACREMADEQIPNVYIAVTNSEQSLCYRISSGIFDTQVEALAYMKSLRAQGVDGFVRKYQRGIPAVADSTDYPL